MRHALATALLMVAPVAASAADTVRCDGAFTRDATHAGLARHYGDANMFFGDIDGPEGTRQMASVLYPNDPKRRLEIIWRDTEARARPAEIRILRRSRWSVPGGARIGIRLSALEQRNGRRLKLAGLDWQYGPLIRDWRDGVFGKLPGGCTLTVRLTLPGGLERWGLDNPSEKWLRRQKVTAQEIVITYPE